MQLSYTDIYVREKSAHRVAFNPVEKLIASRQLQFRLEICLFVRRSHRHAAEALFVRYETRTDVSLIRAQSRLFYPIYVRRSHLAEGGVRFKSSYILPARAEITELIAIYQLHSRILNTS